jgi:hypothetical protein
MLLDYSYGQWIGIIEYFMIVFALGIGVCLLSYKLTYKNFNKKRKVIKSRKVNHKKQIFFDVA